MKIALACIVKNEAHVIERMLRSHKDVVQHFVICDTGSSDDTIAVCHRTAQELGIPLTLYQDEWVDFGHNRTLMMRHASGVADYILVNDADHIWHGTLPEKLDGDCYTIEYRYDATHYGVCCLFRDGIDWKYVGVLHEYAMGEPNTGRPVPLETGWIEVKHEGARSKDPLTYRKDAALLERACEKEPNNQRYMFYLAQSYRDSNQIDKAIECYRKRTQMPGWDQETWYAYYQIGYLLELSKAPAEQVSAAYLATYQFRPARAEALVRLARYHRLREEFALAYLYASHGAMIPMTTDGLFVEFPVYEWAALDELMISAWYADKKQVGKEALKALLTRNYPSSQKARIEDAMKWYGITPVDKLAA